MITARYNWDMDTVLPGFSLHIQTQPLFGLLPVVPFFAIGFGIFKVCTDPQPVADGLPPIVIGAMLLLGLRPYLRWQFRRTVRTNPAYGRELSWVFDPEKVAVSGGDSAATFAWKALYSATISREGLLLYPQKSLFHWVPRAAFSSDADYAAVSGYLTESGVRIKRV